MLQELFAPTTTDEWRSRIVKELKGADYATLIKKHYEGFESLPFYHEDTQISPAIMPPREAQGWSARQDYVLHPERVATLRALMQENLANEVSAFGLHLHTPADADAIKSLLKGLPVSEMELYLHLGDKETLRAAHDALAAVGQPAFLCLTYDPLAFALTTGRLDLRELEGFAQFDAGGLRVDAVGVDAAYFYDAGASAVQELAFACELLQLARFSSDFQGPFVVSLSAGRHYCMEIAKFRAARKLMAEIVGPTGFRLHARTAVWTYTETDVHTNLVRATTEAVSAIVGGCDLLTVAPFDALTVAPNAESDRLARNLHHVLRYEAHLDVVNDPAAGAYYIEFLTDALHTHAKVFAAKIHEMGGVLAFLGVGKLQNAVARTFEQKKEALMAGREVVLGVNRATHVAAAAVREQAPHPFYPPPVADPNVKPLSLQRAAQLAANA